MLQVAAAAAADGGCTSSGAAVMAFPAIGAAAWPGGAVGKGYDRNRFVVVESSNAAKTQGLGGAY